MRAGLPQDIPHSLYASGFSSAHPIQTLIFVAFQPSDRKTLDKNFYHGCISVPWISCTFEQPAQRTTINSKNSSNFPSQTILTPAQFTRKLAAQVQGSNIKVLIHPTLGQKVQIHNKATALPQEILQILLSFLLSLDFCILKVFEGIKNCENSS